MPQATPKPSPAPAPDTAPAQPGYDPMALAESMASAAEKSAKLLGEFASRRAQSGPPMLADELGVGRAFMELASQMLTNPAKLAESNIQLWQQYMSLWQHSMMRAWGADVAPIAEPVKGDKRFKDAGWQDHLLFDYIKQSYLIAARWLHENVASVEGLPEPTKRKVDFFTRQYIDALAPSNFALTNPEVFRETIATGGQNLVKGLTTCSTTSSAATGS